MRRPKQSPKLYCVSLDPALEDQIASYIDRSSDSTTMTMPPAVANKVTAAMLQQLQRLMAAGHQPVVLASPQVRGQVRRLLEPHLPDERGAGLQRGEQGGGGGVARASAIGEGERGSAELQPQGIDA